MGRQAKYSTEQILDAAATVLARGGPAAATVLAIAAELGAPSGSIYHRFASRDLILATLWVRTIQRFQHGYLEALEQEPLDVAHDAAVRHVLDWCAENPDDARTLLLFNREALLAAWPIELGSELATLNDGIEAALSSYVVRRFGELNSETIGKTRLALIDVPYTAARHHLLAGSEPEGWLADAVLAASRSIVALPASTASPRSEP